MLMPTVAALAVVSLALPLLMHVLLLVSLAPPRIPHQRSPADVGIPDNDVQTIWLEGENGKRLYAWLIMPSVRDAQDAARCPATVVLHGWGSNADMMLDIAPPLCAAGHAVLLLDARSHGRSDGESYASMPRFAEDVATALAYLRELPTIDPGRLSLIGHSVGAGAVLLHAARHRDVHGVISLSAFAHPREVMQRWLVERRLPLATLGEMVLQHVQRVIGARFDDIAPVRTIAQVQCPVLIVHGTNDDIVPFDDARRLAAAGQRTVLLPVAGGHDLRGVLSPHAQALVDFLHRSRVP